MKLAQLTFETGAATHLGKVRRRDENCHLVRSEASAKRSQQAYDRMIATPLERGAIDNVTVIVARYRQNDQTAESLQ